MKARCLVLLLAAWTPAFLLPAQEPPEPGPHVRQLEERVRQLEAREREWQARVRELEQRLARIESAGGGPSRNRPAAGAAMEAARTAPTVPAAVQAALSPAAGTGVSPAPAADQSEESARLPYAGYMEFHLNKPRGESSQLDFHRFVLLFGHSFSSRIKFWSELEVEHAFVEGGEEKGELELEQAYLDFYLKPYFNLRGGMLLAPVGLINERHEPPAFFGVERPMVDTVIIPSTWFDTGAGAWGDLGRGFSYRAYLMSPLDAVGFSAAEGLRGGRQKGFQSNLRTLAKTARVEYRGVPRLTLGGSVWGGSSGFDTPNLAVPVRLASVDGRYSWNRLDFRGEYAHGWLRQAEALNRLLQRRRGIQPNIAEQIRGFYGEAAVHLFPRRSAHDFAVFGRYENFDTQYRMPAGFLPLKQFDRSSWTVGASYYPHSDVVLKADYVLNRNASQVVRPRNQFNFGIGWWF